MLEGALCVRRSTVLEGALCQGLCHDVVVSEAHPYLTTLASVGCNTTLTRYMSVSQFFNNNPYTIELCGGANNE